MAHEKEKELLERASYLIGNPGANISGSTDCACDEWQKDYKAFLSTLPEEKEENKWISVKDKMPNPEIPLLVYGLNEYKKGRRLRACWIPQYYMSTDESEYEGTPDYNEEKDEYYWPQGWYEWNEHEDIHFLIDFDITHWMPLPEFNPSK